MSGISNTSKHDIFATPRAPQKSSLFMQTIDTQKLNSQLLTPLLNKSFSGKQHNKTDEDIIEKFSYLPLKGLVYTLITNKIYS